MAAVIFASRLMLFFKAELQAGERWITVHPHGPGTIGQPVLIRPEPKGGGYRIIGGAGGALNYTKITSVKSEDSYKQELAQRQAGRKEEKKRRAASDKAHGLSASKAKAKEALTAQVGDRKAKFIGTVAAALGWTPEEMRFPVEQYGNVSESARKQAAEKHGRELLKRAVAAVDFQRKRVVVDAEARSSAGLAEVPLSSASADQISVQDLDPITPDGAGLGYAPDYAGRAEAHGAKPEDVAAEAAAVKPQTERQTEAKAERHAKTERIAKELQAVRDPMPKLDTAVMIDAKQTVALLQAAKELRAVVKQAREKKRQIEGADQPIEPKAYILEEEGPVSADAITADLEGDLRTLRTRGFLAEIGKLGDGASLGRHIGAGGFNAVNSLALAAGGAALIDRSVVDVLGVAGAAQVLARRLRSDLTPAEYDETAAGVAAFHIDHYMQLSDESLRAAREWQEMAGEIEIGEAADGADLAVAQELNAKRRDFTRAAQQVLGTSLGEMEGYAALTVALGQPAKKKVQVSLGKTSAVSAIRQARALGLNRGEYEVAEAGGNTVLTVFDTGLDRLAEPVSRADMTATRQSLDIIEGRQDEEDWLPQGVADRPDLAMHVPQGVASQLAKPFKVAAGGVGGAIEDYIGGRTADGDAPADIIKGLLSEDTLQAAGDREAFISALDAIAPLYSQDGRMVRVETYADKFNELADSFVQRTYGADRTPIQRQQFPVDATSIDALHRALAAHPDGVAAFKPVGELSPQDQGALRNAFARQYGKVDKAAAKLQAKANALATQEPPKEAEGLFGVGPNPDWARWKAESDQAAEAVSAATMDWNKYVAVQGSPANAYAAMQDVVRGDVIKAFADAHNTLRPKQPLKLGRQVIAHDIAHLDALDPVARDKRLTAQRGLIDSLRNRVAGKYASGSVAEKQEAARAADLAAGQAQMGLFGSTDDTAKAEKAPELGERYSVGHEAERQIAGMMSVVGKNFRPGQPVKLWKPTMSGKFIERQRAVKLIEHNKRTVLAMGVGSGKTSVMLSAFTDLKAKGGAHRGLFLVPGIVQGQFHAEALTLLKPGQFNWHADPSADRAARMRAYQDPTNDFSVVTHQAFRDDLLHLASTQIPDSTPEQIAARMDSMTPEARAEFSKGVLSKAGIDFDYLAVDEGHNLLNRAGKQNSHIANVIDSVSANTPYYVNSTADPVKNDASECFDILSKMRPGKYRDRDAFMRKYGVDTEVSRDALKREMAGSFYTAKIDPGVAARKREVSVDVSGQGDKIRALDKAAGDARLARMRGDVDVAAMKLLSPSSFEGQPEGMHAEIAKALQGNLGIIHNTALQHAISDGAKVDALAKVAAEHKGKPGVVFIHSLDRVREAAERLTKEGHRVVTLTGADSAAEKDRKKREYQRGDYDIMVASDAGCVGANLQAGKWLVQFDTPNTAMTHAQRNGRIHRIGQTEDVDLIDLVADHPSERRARERLVKKYGLRSVVVSPLDGLDESGLAGYLSQAKAGTLKPHESYVAGGQGEAEPPQPERGQLELPS